MHQWAKQKDVAAESSGESEFVAMVFACKEALFLAQVMDEFGIVLAGPPNIFVDSTVAISMCKRGTGRIKHIDSKIAWVRNYVTDRKVTITNVLGEVNLADIYTKYVEWLVMQKLRASVMGSGPPTYNPPGGIKPAS